MNPTSEFTDAERRLVRSYLTHPPSLVDALFSYGAFILPTLVFAIYAFVSASCRELLLAYIALLTVVVLYVMQALPRHRVLDSALRKYEARVKALEPSPADPRE